MAGVALVGITVIGAGAPGVLATSADLTESQRLVTFAELNRQAVTLAHSLADERDEVTAYVAAGRDAAPGNGQDGQGSQDGADGTEGTDGASGAGETGGRAKPALSTAHSARVDRQIQEIRDAAPDDVRRALADVPSLRRTALTGDGTALAAHRAYTEVIDKLRALAARLADRTPARAADGPGRAPAELGQAVEQASATRGLLLAALAVPTPGGGGRTVYDPVSGRYVTEEDPGAATAARSRDELSAAAHRARVREQVALADFGSTADAASRESLAATVTGPEVKAAEDYLGKLADGPTLTRAERKTDPERLSAALTARIEQMRGVESTLATRQVERMEGLRDSDVTTLELRIALLGGCLLVAIGVSTAVARTLTRPLAVLRLGAARVAAAPESEEPVRFTGRNDEFAQVVRSLNTLQGKLLELSTRAARDERRESATAELAAHHAELRAETERLTAELERQRHSVHHTFVNLSLRTLGLVERQLTVIEKLEDREQDPERLATLFKLDHMATVMRRHSENLLILAGHEHSHAHQGPVPLVDVLRAAVSEIERYERVAIQSLPQHAYVAGFAADDISHLLAELLENATSFSPPDATVQLSGWLLDGGDVMLSVRDKGIGITPARLADLNARLADPALAEAAAVPSRGGAAGQEGAPEGEGLGLRVAALLAARHGARVELRAEQDGGVTAVVVLPQALLPDAPPTAGPPAVALAEGMPTVSLPGSVAEANSNALPPRRPEPEEPVRDTAPEAATEPVGVEEQPAGDAAPEQAAEPVGDTAEPVRDAAPVREDENQDQQPRAGERDQDEDRDHPADRHGAPDEHAPAADAADDTPQDGPAVHEATLQVRLPAPGGGSEHARAADDGPTAERVTDKGLPKRTPRIVDAGLPRAERSGGVNAEELRRRLGGFHKGAKEGRRDVEAELSGVTEEAAPGTGDTVEEAHS
ncbi:sensor histidine kinase [Streptomyces thermolilacinus]|uniref:Signal transduction histidine-protein kinase/phosphatase MprB n=1 Tax=Streptomyces thermolilacinus SPC6 TaxID=1306406 RepID=A0A1D3DQ27_9ACTN|nr:nitrate- and nitrite sensing domain-containing protein [Streptomyces thermolilacinus]OEJ94423.1 histidine kinase [Streptomyces thermolilacinus SPC6]